MRTPEELPEAEFFTLKTPLLSAGSTNNLVASSEQLWAVVKVYAAGGENALHGHPDEDHLFVILDGQAVFYGKEGQTTLVKKHQGVMLPKGTLYYFNAVGEENLVMLRVGAGGENPFAQGAKDPRVDAHGNPFPASSPENKTGSTAGVAIPNQFFGD